MKAQYTKPVAKLVKFEYKQAVVASPTTCRWIAGYTNQVPNVYLCGELLVDPPYGTKAFDCYWDHEAAV